MKLPIFLTRDHWKNCRQWKTGIRASCYFYAFYAWTWGILESLSHFVPAIEKWSLGNFVLLLVIALIGLVIGCAWFIYECARMLSVRKKLEETDIWIEIKVGDIFNLKGDYIIGTNTKFETSFSNGRISEGSLQGQLTKKYYDKPEQLDLDLLKALKDEVESNQNPGHYKFGTVAKVTAKNQTVYLVAIDELNEHGGVSSSLEDVRESLMALWQHIGRRSKPDNLVIPIIGTKSSGIPVPRATMITEIIKSFIDATYSEKHFCQTLTIIISEDDYRQQNIDLQELGTYLHVHATQKKWEIQERRKPVGESITHI